MNTLLTKALAFLHIGAADASNISQNANAITGALEGGEQSVITKAEAYITPAEKLLVDLKSLFTHHGVSDVDKLVGDTLALMGTKQVAVAAQIGQSGDSLAQSGRQSEAFLAQNGGMAQAAT